MFIVLMPRVGTPHIYNYNMSNGKYRTVCNLTMSKENTQLTLCVDASIPGICSNCSAEADDMYLDDLNTEPRLARNVWQMRLCNLREFHNQEILGPSSSVYSMISRRWDKLIRLKFKLNRKKKK